MALDKTKVVYQIYPKSYKDTTGNGIGDFRGIIEKIPYLAELGVDMVWLNPFYPSPQRDNGYDISDYTAVNPVFGDMADFEEMVRVGKEHKIDFMLDMVLNHCSTEHEWFQKALAGDKYYQDFFFIQDQPTDWLSKFGGSAWLLLEIQGNTIFTSLMKHRQTSIGEIPMSARSCSRWSTSGVTRASKDSVSM